MPSLTAAARSDHPSLLFPADDFKRLEHFHPRTKCSSTLRLKRQLIPSNISFHDIRSKFGVYSCSPSERSHVATSFSTAGSKSSSSFFMPRPRPRFPAAYDEPLLTVGAEAWSRRGERPPVRPGPPPHDPHEVA